MVATGNDRTMTTEGRNSVYISNNLALIYDVMDLNTPFWRSDIVDTGLGTHGDFVRLRDESVITKYDDSKQVPPGGRYADAKWRWHVEPELEAAIRDKWPDPRSDAPCECGRSCVRNVRDGGFECRHCGRELDRETVAEYFG